MHDPNAPAASRQRRRFRPCRRRSPMRRLLGLPLLVLTLPLFATGATAEGAIAYRQHVMAAADGHMQATAAILRGQVPYEDHVRVHANALAGLAAIADTLFPQGSEGGDTLPAAWQRPVDFVRRMRDFQEAAAAFVAAVDARDGVAPAFQKVIDSCDNCHDRYRAPSPAAVQSIDPARAADADQK